MHNIGVGNDVEVTFNTWPQLFLIAKMVIISQLTGIPNDNVALPVTILFFKMLIVSVDESQPLSFTRDAAIDNKYQIITRRCGNRIRSNQVGMSSAIIFPHQFHTL